MIEILLIILIVLVFVLCVLGFMLIKRINDVVLPSLTIEFESLLKNITESLAIAARLAKTVATDLELNVAEARQQFSRLVILIEHLQQEITSITSADAIVASNLKDVQDHAKGIEQKTPGAKADAAASGLKAIKVKKKT